MRIKHCVGGLAVISLLAVPATPAMARGFGGFGIGSSWGGGWGNGWGRDHHRHGDDDTGEVLAGVLIGAILVGVAASAAKKSKERRDYPRDGYPDRRSDNGRGGIQNENAAVDACASAAETQGGEAASVRDITKVRNSADGWDVEGTLEQRSGWRDRAPKLRSFTCSVRYGAVDSVYIDGNAVAQN